MKQGNLSEELFKHQDHVDNIILSQLATSEDGQLIVEDLMSKDIPTQLRAFMLLKARRELKRIIKVTEILEQLEDTYMERALADQEGMDMKSLSTTLEKVSAILSRSLELVYKVINDKELKIIVEENSTIYQDNRTTNYVSIIQKKGSRERLRDISTRLLSSVEKNPALIVNSEPLDDEEDTVQEVIDIEVEDGIQ